MTIRVAINGFGRIGRIFLRAAVDREAPIDVVAVNDLGDPSSMAMLLRHDSVYGPYPGRVAEEDGELRAGERTFPIFSEPDPRKLPWEELGVDVVLESTGHFRKREQAELHLEAGASTVVISAPATDPDVTLVLGVNDEQYRPEQHRIISNASCTTNCIAPVAKVLNDAFGVEAGFMTTIHAYTNDQSVLDQPHKDPRRARAAGINLIPTSTGAAKAIGLVIPELAGKLDGVAVRAPVPTGSLVDFGAHLSRPVTAGEVNAAFAGAAAGKRLGGILEYSTDPLVSSDVIRSPYSAIVDSALTMARGQEVRVFAWYDNEWGYSCRLVDLIATMIEPIQAAPQKLPRKAVAVP
jgi:glyceraldehyde 3-phosphate dehydrogenase (phosphorylating)